MQHINQFIKSAIITGLLLFSSGTLVAQEKAKDFDYHDLEGSVQSLTDLNGEVVYMSFWASWCRPCISNFRKYYEIREELEKEGVVLLNINIDKDKDKWQQSLDINPWINGTNVRADDIAKVQELYELYSIPSYEILNKKGSLVYLSDEPGRSIIQSFREWLSQ